MTTMKPLDTYRTRELREALASRSLAPARRAHILAELDARRLAAAAGEPWARGQRARDLAPIGRERLRALAEARAHGVIG